MWKMLTCLSAIVALCFTSASATGQDCVPHWLAGEAVPGVAGSTMSGIVWDPDGPGPQPEVLVVGGTFAAAGGVQANNIAAWDGLGWSALGPGLPSGQVSALAVFNGRLIAARWGTVTSVSQWDGSTWTTIAPFANVNAMLVYNNELVVAGGFAGMGVQALAAWNGSTWRQLGTPPSGAAYYSLGIHNGQLYVGGSNAVWRYNGTSLVNIGATAPVSLQPYVTAITSFGGQLVVGGGFTSIGGVAASCVARWDGTTWSPMGTRVANDFVRGFLIRNNTLYACGPFLALAPGQTLFVAQWDGTDWHTVGSGGYWSSGGGPNAIMNFGGDIHVVGAYMMAGVGTLGAARWTGTAWQPLGSTLNSSVRCLVQTPGGIVAGGDFTFAGGAPASRVALWDGAAWSALGNGFDGSGLQAVESLAYFEGSIIAAGSFMHSGADPIAGVARWDGVQWRPMGSTAYQVDNLLVVGDRLYASGIFPSMSNLRQVVRWNGAEWEAISAFSVETTALGLFNGSLVAASNGVHVWNGSAWLDLGGPGNGSYYNRVNALMQFGDLLVAGGSFTSPQYILAAWNGTSWQQLGLTLSSSGPLSVNALAVHAGALIVGGSFTSAGSLAANNVAAWNGSTWSSFGTGVNGPSYALLSLPEVIIVGGSFTVAGGLPSAMMARWSTPTAPMISQPPVPSVVCQGTQVTLSLATVGTPPASYQWRRDTAELAGATSASLLIPAATSADAGLYDCVLTNGCGTIISPSARLTVSTADFDGNGDVGTDADIEAFFACLSGDCCAVCGSVDFNGDGDIGTDADIDAFFRVLGGGPC